MTTRHASTPQTTAQYPRLTPLPDPPKPQDAMMQQLPYVCRAYIILDDYYHLRTDVFVGGDGYLCYDTRDLPHSPRPDCVVAFGVAIPPALIEEANGYMISEVGMPPNFVLEVASASTGRRDYTVKRGIYAGYGVLEFWRFDHTGGRYHDAALAGDRLVGGEYEPIPVVTGADGVVRGYSAELGLELHWDSGKLRFWEPATGEYLPDLTEAKAQRDAEAEARRNAESRAAIEQSARRNAESRAAIEQSARRNAESRAAIEQSARRNAEERIRELEAELRRRQSES